MIENIFFSFKSKLHDLQGTNQSLQSFMTKVTYEARIGTVYIYCSLEIFEYRFSVFFQVQSLNPRLWITSEISGDAELDLLFSTVNN